MDHTACHESAARPFAKDHLDGGLKAQTLPSAPHSRAAEVTERLHLLKTVFGHVTALAAAAVAVVELTSLATGQEAVPAGLEGALVWARPVGGAMALAHGE